jgi:bifunctional pyridoxal-dependent enzyme with beta-cystathionase and maltose regulon repressor activities
MSDFFFNSATLEKMANTRKDSYMKDQPDVIQLTVADPDFRVAPEIKKAIIQAVESEDFSYKFTETSMEEKCAQKIAEFNKIPAIKEDIHITNGTIPGIWLAQKVACKPGDEVIVTDPMYYPFMLMSQVHQTKPVKWALDYDTGYKFDNEKLKEIITPKTKLIYVCNPHNPTGRVMTKDELKGIADVAVDHKITVMSDELWEDVLLDGRKHISIASLNPEIERLTLTQFGFSKAFNVAGLRIGYLCITNKELYQSTKLQAMAAYMAPTNIAKAAGKVMLSRDLNWWLKGMIEHITKIRGICEKWFDSLPNITYPKLEATYLMFPKFNYKMSSEKLEEYLVKEAKVRLDHGTIFGELGEGHQRILIATSENIIKEALERMEKALNKLP